MSRGQIVVCILRVVSCKPNLITTILLSDRVAELLSILNGKQSTHSLSLSLVFILLIDLSYFTGKISVGNLLGHMGDTLWRRIICC